MALFRPFAGLTNRERLSDRVTILRFRHLLEKHRLDVQILATVNATIQQQENAEATFVLKSIVGRRQSATLG